MRLKRLIWALAVLYLPYISQAQEKKDSVMRFSLKEAQTFALTNSYNIQNAKLDLESAKKKILETTAIGLPQFSAKASYQNIFKVPELSLGVGMDPSKLPKGTPLTAQDILNSYVQAPPVPLGVKENTTFDFTVSQLIFSGEYIVGLQASRVFKEFSEQSITKSETDTRESVSKTYCMAIITNENLVILQSSLYVVNKTLNEIVQMNKQGFNEETDVDQLQISKSNLENLIFSLKNQNEVVTRLLKFQMGIDVEKAIILTDSVNSIVDAGNTQYLNNISFDVQNNIDYKIMATNENLNLLSLRREKTKFLPSIAAYYRYERLATVPQFNFNPPNVLGISIDVPIFSSGMRYARVKQASIALAKSKIASLEVEQSLKMDFEQSKNAYAIALNAYNTQKQNLNLAEKIYKRTISKYKEGVSSSFELNQIQNQLLTTQGSYFNASLELFNAKAKLEKILTTAK
jgi:outer membrane protein TolC